MTYKTYIAVDERVANWPGFRVALLEIQDTFNRVNISVEMQMDDIEVVPAGLFVDPNDSETEAGNIENVYQRWKQWSPLRKKLWETPNGAVPPHVRVLYLPYYVPVQQSSHPRGVTAGRTYRFGEGYVEMVHDIYALLLRRNEMLRKVENNYNPNDKEALQFLTLILHEMGHSFGAEHDGWWDYEKHEMAGTEQISIMFGDITVLSNKSDLLFSRKSLKEMEGYMAYDSIPKSIYWRPEENWRPKIVSKKVDKGRFDTVSDFVTGRFSHALYPNGDERPYSWIDSVTGKTINVRQKVEICLDIFGAVHPDDAQRLFYQDHADVLKYLAPKLGWPMKLDNSNIFVQGYCQNTYGLLDNFRNEVMGTYNAGLSETLVSRQGYRHTGNDISGDPAHFFNNNKNLLINPFPDGMPVIAIRRHDGQEDRDGAKEDHGKSGNAYEINAYLDGDTKNPEPWNRMTVRFVHCKKNSWMFDDDEIQLTEASVAIGKIGCSGYSSIGGMHSHVVFYLSTETFNPFYGKNSFFLKAPLFRDQEGLLNLIDYPRTSRKRTYTNTITGKSAYVSVFPQNYKESEGYIHFLRFKVDAGDMSQASAITPGTHKYVFESNVKMSEIWFDQNPWGKWKPIQEPWKPTNWWKWLKEKFNQIVLDKPTSRNLMDYSIMEPEFSEFERIIAYKDGKTSLLYERPEDAPDTVELLETIKVKVYTITLVVPSKKHDNPLAYGYYTFFAIDNKGNRTNRVILKLDKEA